MGLYFYFSIEKGKENIDLEIKTKNQGRIFGWKLVLPKADTLLLKRIELSVHNAEMNKFTERTVLVELDSLR